jgi:hypothetical protein
MSKFKKLFSPKKVYSAKKLLAQTTVLKKIFRTFDDNLDHIESRLATEEKFIKHNASGLLDSLRVFWKKDEELFHEMASNVKELYAFVNSEYAWLGIKIVGGSFLGVLGFYFASQPAEPAQFNDLSPGGYFLVGIYLSSVALYNLAKACAVIDKEEIAEFFMLKNTIIKSERK